MYIHYKNCKYHIGKHSCSTTKEIRQGNLENAHQPSSLIFE